MLKLISKKNCQAPSRWESREQVVLVKPVTTRCLRLIDHDAKVISNIIDISVLNIDSIPGLTISQLLV